MLPGGSRCPRPAFGGCRGRVIYPVTASQSDFYSYRYFASEGFLPEYSFPRLPISAFIPGRRAKAGTDDFLSRPRFLAISEFGPRNFVYHEGSRYVINRVILPVSSALDPESGRSIPTITAKIFLLGGHNWARWLAVAWLAFHVAISYPATGQLAVHGAFLAIIAGLLFQPSVGRYFARGIASAGGDAGAAVP